MARSRIPLSVSADGASSSRCACASPSAGDELLDIDFIGAAGFGIDEVSEPFEFGENVGEVAEPGGG